MKNITITVKNNEEKIVPIIWTNDEEEEIQLTAKLVGNNCSLTVVGIFFGNGSNKVVFNTDVTHIGLNTKSLTTLRAVMKNNAGFNNDGMVRIQKGAKNTNGYFQSKVLLFDDAKGRSVPSLEIDENEVKAGHGSTIGRPDADQLLYMQSRGIPEKVAEELIITGFFEPMILLLPNEDQQSVRTQLEKFVTIEK